MTDVRLFRALLEVGTLTEGVGHHGVRVIPTMRYYRVLIPLQKRRSFAIEASDILYFFQFLCHSMLYFYFFDGKLYSWILFVYKFSCHDFDALAVVLDGFATLQTIKENLETSIKVLSIACKVHV